jgi:hypothetical protein
MTYRPLDDDPRWKRFQHEAWTCPSCGGEHAGLFDLAHAKPEQWPDGEEKQPNGAVHSLNHVLTEDCCIIDGEHFFVRCVLELSIVGASDAVFGYGVWSTLSKKNFDIYLSHFDEGQRGELGPWFGWFSNRLKGYPDTLNLKCQVHPQPNRQRPLIEIEPADHPLAIEQRDGITFDRLLEIYALNGHDIGPALQHS